MVSENDGTVEVCVQISGLPAGGLGCDIIVNFDLLPGLLAGMYNIKWRRGSVKIDLFCVTKDCYQIESIVL